MKQKLWELHSHKHWHRKFPRNTKRIKNFEGPLLTNRKVWGWNILGNLMINCRKHGIEKLNI